jgi:hypothetical protein
MRYYYGEPSSSQAVQAKAVQTELSGLAALGRFHFPGMRLARSGLRMGMRGARLGVRYGAHPGFNAELPGGGRWGASSFVGRVQRKLNPLRIPGGYNYNNPASFMFNNPGGNFFPGFFPGFQPNYFQPNIQQQLRGLGESATPPRHRHGLGMSVFHPSRRRWSWRPGTGGTRGLSMISAGNDTIAGVGYDDSWDDYQPSMRLRGLHMISAGNDTIAGMGYDDSWDDYQPSMRLKGLAQMPAGNDTFAGMGDASNWRRNILPDGTTTKNWSFLGQDMPSIAPQDMVEDPAVQAYLTNLIDKAKNFGALYSQFQDDIAYVRANAAELLPEGLRIQALADSAKAKVEEINRLVDSSRNWLYDSIGLHGVGILPLIVGAAIVIAAIALVSDAIVKMDAFHKKVDLVREGKLSGSSLDRGVTGQSLFGGLSSTAMWIALAAGVVILGPQLFKR